MKLVKIILILLLIAADIQAQTRVVKAKHHSKITAVNKKNKQKVLISYKSKSLSGNKSSLTNTISKEKLSMIKAVLVVGPVEESTKDFIEETKVVAVYLRSMGVKVIELYDSAAEWNKIVAASKGAHIFIYSGHGTDLGEEGKPGGLCLSNGTSVSSQIISKELKLHKNALVMFNHVCQAAGSSAGDNSDIGCNTAFKRVSDYSYPFVKMGVGCYYVNNYSNSMVPFLKEFFNKKNVIGIYKEKASSYCKIEKIQKNSYNQKYEVSVASATNSGCFTRTSTVNGIKKIEKLPCFKQYDIAFVGIPGFTVLDFYK